MCLDKKSVFNPRFGRADAAEHLGERAGVAEPHDAVLIWILV